jgi:hypothetical protein
VINSGLKTVPKLFQIYFSGARRACHEIEVFRQLLSHLRLFRKCQRWGGTQWLSNRVGSGKRHLTKTA